MRTSPNSARQNARRRDTFVGRISLPGILPSLVRSIEVHGSALEALPFIRTHASLWRMLIGESTHLRPPPFKRYRAFATPSLTSALELSALMLLPHSQVLQTFVTLTDETVDPLLGPPADPLNPARQQELGELEQQLGYSDWLACEWIGLLPPGSDQQVKLVESLMDHHRCVAIDYLAPLTFQLLTGSHVASHVSKFVCGFGLPAEVEAHARAYLDPVPDLDASTAGHALTIARNATPIDHWLVWSKLIIAASVREELPATLLQPGGASGALLRAVGGVIAANILESFGSGSQPGRVPPSRTLLELWLDAIADTDEPVNTTANPLNAALDQVMAAGHVSGPLAVLDRVALASGQGRSGMQLAALSRQLASFTDRRASHAAKWFAISTHPRVVPTLNGVPVATAFRLASVPAERRHLLSAALLAASGDNPGAVLGALGDANDDSPEESALRVDSLIALGDPQTTLAAVALLIARHPTIVPRLPFDELADLLPKGAAESLRSSLYATVLCEAAVRHGTVDLLAARNDFFEDVLENAAVDSPADAVAALMSSEVPPSLVEHFLEKVCVLNIMDSVPVGRSTAELFNARIAVLNALRALAPTRSADFDAEIREVAIANAVRRELSSINQQRVYVDVEGLSNRLVATLALDFERYQRYARLDPHRKNNDELYRFLKEQFPDWTLVDPSEFMRALTSEADRAFARMAVVSRSEFAVSNEFGLDGYLSGGIRHGNLESHLREPFATAGLLGTLGGVNGFELPPWANALRQLIPTEHDWSQAFQHLTLSFQGIVDEVLNDWVRIELSEPDSPAFFDFRLTHAHVRLLESRVRGCVTIEAAIGVFIDFYLEMVNSSLEKAQERIRTDLSERLHAILDSFAAQILGESRDSRLQALVDNVVTPTRGRLDTAIDTLAEWFRRAEYDRDVLVDPRLPLEISAKLITKAYPEVSFQWSTAIDAEGLRLSRRVMKHWVDIVHTLLSNVATHSGGSPKCAVQLKFTASPESVLLEVRNQLPSEVNLESLDARILEVTHRLSAPGSLTAVRREGQSGLVKVKKYATIDLRCPDAVVTVAREGGVFATTVYLPGPIVGFTEETCE